MKIGFFDSGVGGITVLSEALKLLPEENYIYYADTEHVPYGIRNREEVLKNILEAVEFISQEGIKALVVACNTATSIAISELRSRYCFPVLGMEPAVKPALEKNGSKRIMVCATPLTLHEEKYQNLMVRLGHADMVDGVALPELVEYAENFIFDEKIINEYLKRKFCSYDLNRFGTVVLGCTHFPFYRDSFQKVFPPGTEIIDGSTGTVKYLKKILVERDLCEKGGGDIIFYSSGKKQSADSRYEKYLKLLQEKQTPI